jgi:hypothetical protein
MVLYDVNLTVISLTLKFNKFFNLNADILLI